MGEGEGAGAGGGGGREGEGEGEPAGGGGEGRTQDLAARDGPEAGRGAALARPGRGLLPEGAAQEGIAGLPVTALRRWRDVAGGLARLGPDRIGDLTALTRAPCGARLYTTVAQPTSDTSEYAVPHHPHSRL